MFVHDYAPIYAWLILGGVTLLVALAIAWIVLPFAIIGTKPILRDLLDAVRDGNQLARDLNARLGPPTSLTSDKGDKR
jgi:hypothetical protein